jgi:hypothetical protein
MYKKIPFLFLFLLFCLNLPCSAWGKTPEKISRVHQEALTLWKQSREILAKFNQNNMENATGQLHQALSLCNQAIQSLDKVIETFGKQKRKKTEFWQKSLKNQCFQERQSCLQLKKELLKLLHHHEQLSRAQSLFNESLKKAALARESSDRCVYLTNNPKELAKTLTTASTLFKEAIILANQALERLSSHQQKERTAIMETLSLYQSAYDICEEESIKWQESLNAREEKTLQEEKPQTPLKDSPCTCPCSKRKMNN